MRYKFGTPTFRLYMFSTKNKHKQLMCRDNTRESEHKLEIHNSIKSLHKNYFLQNENWSIILQDIANLAQV